MRRIVMLCCSAAIGKLRRDNIALKDELMLENKFSVAPTLASASDLIANLQAQSNVYTTKVPTIPHCSPARPAQHAHTLHAPPTHLSYYR